MKKLLLIGGGGHCKSVLDSLIYAQYQQIAICDVAHKVGQYVMGVPVIGCDSDLPALFKAGYTRAVVTLGSVGCTKLRVEVYHILKEIGFSFPSIIDPSAIVSAHASIGEGVFIGKGAVINACVNVGDFCILNTGCVVEHDCSIGDFAHIASGAVLSGAVHVGAHAHIGANAVVIQKITVGDDANIGAGSVVVRDISTDVTAFGNPCRVQKEKQACIRFKL